MQRVESLAQCFEEMSIQRPTPKVTDARMADWRKQLRRLAQQKVTQVVEDLDLATFVQEGTDGPVRALALWLNKAGTKNWNLTNVTEASNTRTRKRQQAVVAEPGI